MWWVMDYFKVLPTDEKFQNLTNEQILLLIEAKKHEIKQAERRSTMGGNLREYSKEELGSFEEHFVDFDYDKWEKEELEKLSNKEQKDGWVKL